MSASVASAGVAVGSIDAMTGAANGIDYAHHEVHGGSSFSVGHINASMNDTDTIELVFKTPPGTKRAHLIVGFSTLVGGTLQLWEGPTWTAQTGTEIDILNRKREAVMGSSMLLADKSQPTFAAADVVVLNPTALNVGGSAILLQEVHAWGKKDKLYAGGGRDTEEIVLKPDSTYALVFTAVGSSNKARVFLDWYEHTDSN